MLPGVVFKRVLLLLVLISALGKYDLEPLLVVLFILSPVSVELEEDTSVNGGIGLWPLLLNSPLTSCELDVAIENALDWLGFVFEVLDDDGRLNEG